MMANFNVLVAAIIAVTVVLLSCCFADLVKVKIPGSAMEKEDNGPDKKIIAKLGLSIEEFGELFKPFANFYEANQKGDEWKIVDFVIGNFSKTMQDAWQKEPIWKNLFRAQKVKETVPGRNGTTLPHSEGKKQNAAYQFSNRLFLPMFAKRKYEYLPEFCGKKYGKDSCQWLAASFIYKLLAALINELLHKCRNICVECRLWWNQFRNKDPNTAIDPTLDGKKRLPIDSGYASSDDEDLQQQFGGKKRMKLRMTYVQYLRDWRDNFANMANDIQVKLTKHVPTQSTNIEYFLDDNQIKEDVNERLYIYSRFHSYLFSSKNEFYLKRKKKKFYLKK